MSLFSIRPAAESAPAWIPTAESVPLWLRETLPFDIPLEVEAWIAAFTQACMQNPGLAMAAGILLAVPVFAIGGLMLLPSGRRQSNLTADESASLNLDAGGTIRVAGQTLPYQVGNHGLLIGAGPHCEIELDSPGIADAHARIARGERGCAIVRLAGEDDVGIYVNGRLVLHHLLQDGETIKIGPFVLTFETTCPALDEIADQGRRSTWGAGSPAPEGDRRRFGGRRWQGAADEAKVRIQARS